MLVELQYCALTKKAWKTAYYLWYVFIIILPIFLELSIQQIAFLCLFSADRSSELIRRKKFSEI